MTQGQWKSVMDTEPWNGKKFVNVGAKYAAAYVTWDDAEEFCRQLSGMESTTYRLPTEAGWEYACRGGTTTAYSFGDDSSLLGDYAWFAANASNAGGKYAHEVGQKKSNDFGLYDMHGNVSEWCQDGYEVHHARNLIRAYRGGGWSGDAVACRAAERVAGSRRRPARSGLRPSWAETATRGQLRLLAMGPLGQLAGFDVETAGVEVLVDQVADSEFAGVLPGFAPIRQDGFFRVYPLFQGGPTLEIVSDLPEVVDLPFDHFAPIAPWVLGQREVGRKRLAAGFRSVRLGHGVTSVVGDSGDAFCPLATIRGVLFRLYTGCTEVRLGKSEVKETR